MRATSPVQRRIKSLSFSIAGRKEESLQQQAAARELAVTSFKFDVVITQQGSIGLGLSDLDGHGVLVSEIMPGSEIHQDGRVREGMLLSEIGGESLNHVSEVAPLLGRHQPPRTLRFVGGNFLQGRRPRDPAVVRAWRA